ncbi:hypothetical protein Daus18300_009831 [Diaporthe australafricana]|uniref:Ankyrin repeat protein n=1 Tax=Diaporthe australafricana TaxID=127596 RepID=A0ABR3WCK0_9PEZI
MRTPFADKYGHPLHFAIRNGSWGVMKLLLDRLGDDQQELEISLSSLDPGHVESGDAIALLLECNVREGHLKAVILPLLRSNISDPDATLPSRSHGNDAFIDAVRAGDVGHLHGLLVDPADGGTKVTRRLDEALGVVLTTAMGNFEGYPLGPMTELLVNAGADLERFEGEHLDVALAAAKSAGFEHLVQRLLRRGASPMALEKYGVPPEPGMDSISEYGSSSGSAFGELEQSAADFIARSFLKEPHIRKLCVEASQRLGEAQFIRNNRGMLKGLYIDAKDEVQKDPFRKEVKRSQKEAVEFFRSRRRRIELSRSILEKLRAPTLPQDFFPPEPVRHDQGELLGRFLKDCDATGPVQPPPEIVEEEINRDSYSENDNDNDNDSDSDSDSDNDNDSDGPRLRSEDSWLNKLIDTEAFLIQTNAFEKYTARLAQSIGAGVDEPLGPDNAPDMKLAT